MIGAFARFGHSFDCKASKRMPRHILCFSLDSRFQAKAIQSRRQISQNQTGEQHKDSTSKLRSDYFTKATCTFTNHTCSLHTWASILHKGHLLRFLLLSETHRSIYTSQINQNISSKCHMCMPEWNDKGKNSRQELQPCVSKGNWILFTSAYHSSIQYHSEESLTWTAVESCTLNYALQQQFVSLYTYHCIYIPLQKLHISVFHPSILPCEGKR